MGKRYGWVAAYALTICVVLGAVHWGNHAVTVIAENLPVPRQHLIIIDPGHGGEDGGATSCTGRLESSYNLEISMRLRDMLHLLGYASSMVRTTDRALSTSGDTIAQRKLSDLKNRVKMINSEGNAILLSIHQNQYPDSSPKGAQVFYAGTRASETLALKLQSELVSTLNPGSRRKAKRSSGVYLMERIQCPGVLIECGFLSNPGEEAQLSDPEYQKKLSTVIAVSVDQFLRNA